MLVRLAKHPLRVLDVRQPLCLRQPLLDLAHLTQRLAAQLLHQWGSQRGQSLTDAGETGKVLLPAVQPLSRG